MSHPEISVELLPPKLQEFVRLIGVAATLKMVEKYGGLRIYIPVKATPDHEFAKLIGVENLAKLGKVFGLEDHFQLPKAQAALRALRDTKIATEYGPKSVRTLAAEYRLTERGVWAILAKSSIKNEFQMELL